MWCWRSNYVTIFAFFAVTCLFFTAISEAKIAGSHDLNKRLQVFLKNPSLKNVSCGVSIVSVTKNDSLFNYRNNDLFSVASNMKLLTTAAALEYLGPDFEYRTTVCARGIIADSGELRGDLIIRGGGDPNLSGRFYNGNIMAIPESWACAVKKRGIQVIAGDIIADDRIFDRAYTHPNWPENQLSEWYCAPSCGLSFNDNCVDITLVPDKRPGKAVRLFVEPRTSYFTIRNTCIYTSDKKEHRYAISRKPGTNEIVIKGKFWVNASPEKTWVSVHNPALYLATVLKETLEKNGVAVKGSVRLIDENDSFDEEGEPIIQTTSTMRQTILVTNKQSQNFYAEQIMKTLGAQIKGRGTSEAGIEVVREFMGKIGFRPGEYYIDDGCGLSKGNRLSPEMLTTLLAYMSKHSYGKVLLDSLPTSGIDGGLRRRMDAPKYRSRIRAKTGYIARTSTLSGYIDTTQGDVFAFSILMNNFSNLKAMQKIQDGICQAIVDCYQ
ncbi:MAG: D-alanyl-D-alanine carboxypeptidase/D-alanyl-D-alanine-endopeptidase [Candidatus Brocadia sp. AMX3]|nr:D-alanyl-D-alanine carboxypeptidase DacC [Candidatus Brocadia fulgida]MCE7911598.1 D-alanyl-D-alanine carboxypeptidase/D-alanyl-D-alanine-endopeptidase [Candidatus Brocadia sp. AMX3]MDG5997436.1 D-alanyl-D-alanine carboxypeptidase/D-alanyl-D-alanine-endopeptidase [Candidatus Brocadia sp.]